MMSWDMHSYNTSDGAPLATGPSATTVAAGEIRELRMQLERLTLMNQALWELLRERLQLSDMELENKVAEVDMRDGVADGKLTPTAVRCPNCSRVCNARHAKCLYCGQLFQKPLFG